MGEPYTEESGAYNYTHTHLENFPYKSEWQVSLLALLQRYIACTWKGGVYPNSFKKHPESVVKHIESRACLGWIVLSMTVCPCLSQDLFCEGNFVVAQAKGVYFLLHCYQQCVNKQKSSGCNYCPGSYNLQLYVQQCTHMVRYLLWRYVSKLRSRCIPPFILLVRGLLLCSCFLGAVLYPCMMGWNETTKSKLRSGIFVLGCSLGLVILYW